MIFFSLAHLQQPAPRPPRRPLSPHPRLRRPRSTEGGGGGAIPEPRPQPGGLRGLHAPVLAEAGEGVQDLRRGAGMKESNHLS